MKKPILILYLIALSLTGYGQSLIGAQDYLVNGFDQKVAGDDFNYHSSVPNADKALIIRATDGNYAMEWKTAPAPGPITQPYATFAWLAGIGSSPGVSTMILSVDGQEKFRFQTDGKDSWVLSNPDGSALLFDADLEDEHGDKFGFMFLRIPAKQLKKGQILSLKMTGGNNNKSSWYMTFQMSVGFKMNLRPYPAIIKENGQKKQLIAGSIIHFGNTEKATIYVNNKVVKTQELRFGYNYFSLGLPEVTQKTRVTVKLVVGKNMEEAVLEQFPVRQWQVNFVQHSHTDIGYTRSQTEILAEHLRYIDYALDYCDATDHYPEPAKFRWTCEASWAVDEFLKCRPAAQIERLKKRVREGRIEIAAMYFNFDELPEEAALAASLKPVQTFREHGLDTKMAMQNDVNGIAWCMNDYYQDLGIRYLNMGTHGHRALICFETPTLFWWESPSGKRMLAYRGEHYMTGNTVFGIDKGNLPDFETKLLNYLVALGDKGYPYDLISIQHSGYLTDNSPPSTAASEMIRQWNERFEWPKLQTATATAFFETMEAKHSASFPVFRGAWPDWWTDGFGASAREVAAVRKAQSDVLAATGGLTMASLQGAVLPKQINQRIDLINNAMLFYTEHTVGYSESVRAPYHEQTMEQRAIKESYSWEAFRRARMVGEETMGALQQFIPNEATPTLVVFNSLNWNRDGLVQVYIDHQLVPRGKQLQVRDADGTIFPAQAISARSDGTYWGIWLKDIPAFGYRKLRIEAVGDRAGSTTNQQITRFENTWYSVQIDPAKAAITSWFDKSLNKELIDPKAPYTMGEFIYERLGNRHQMEQKRLDDYKRFPFDSAWFDSYSEGPVWNTVHLRGRTAASYAGYEVKIEIRLFHTTKRIDLAYSIVKAPIVEPEGIYIAFPFQLENSKLYFDVQGGVIEAGKDQIPGSSNDWNTVQHFAALRSSDAQILIGSPEIPLMQFGGINTGRYKAGALPETSHLYSWPMNNYWVTNFNPDQKGEHQWTYYLTSEKDASNRFATQFSWGARIPFLSRVLPGNGKGGSSPWAQSFLSGWPENVLLVHTLPEESGRAAVLHLREVDGKPANLDGLRQASGVPLQITRVDVLGSPINGGTTQLKGLESGFFKITW